VVPALADVGAVSALANGVELERAGQLLEGVVVFADRGACLEPLGLGGGSLADGGDLHQFGHGFIVAGRRAVDVAAAPPAKL